MDFPTVTEICDCACGNAVESADVARLLAGALQGVSPDEMSRPLKALTVVHEMLYDQCARDALAEAPGFVSAVMHIHTVRPFRGTGPAAEAVQILAAEIFKRLLTDCVVRL